MSAWVRRQAQRPRRCAAAARLERTRQRRVCLIACLVAWKLGDACEQRRLCFDAAYSAGAASSGACELCAAGAYSSYSGGPAA